MRLVFLIISTLLVAVWAESASDGIENKNSDGDRIGRQHWPQAVPYPSSFPSRSWLVPQFRTNQYSELDDSDDTNEYRSNSYLSWNNKHQAIDGNSEDVAQTRQNAFGLSNINSAVNLFAQLFSRLPSNFILDPNQVQPNLPFTSCTDGNGIGGMCTLSSVCSSLGGRPSGACGIKRVCCINAISKCGGKMTLNNTVWSNPPFVSSDSSCILTVALDTNLIEQFKPVCQVRLDFIAFSIAQPDTTTPSTTTTTQCITDTFTVGGVVNKVPVICGDNAGQHMYLQAPSSTTDISLLFTFGVSTVVRSWNIKVSLIPCGANYAAPTDCLQFFTEATGTVSSFNWKDVNPIVRKLASQDYKMCFRNALINGKRATRICYSTCTVVNNALPFSISGPLAPLASAKDPAACSPDFLMIPNGFDSAIATPTVFADRYCGNVLNPGAANTATSATVCSEARDFNLFYKTDATEVVANANNMGFCLNFDQRLP